MGIYEYRFTLGFAQKCLLTILLCIFALTGCRVEATMAATQDGAFEDDPFQQTDTVQSNDAEIGIEIVPSYFGVLTPAKRIPARGVRLVEMTAYTSEVGQTDQSPFVTANGTRVRDGIVAANFLKFQTRIRLPELYGDKIFVVTDRMHERYTNRVDIWMEKKSEALRFGVKRRVKIEIL